MDSSVTNAHREAYDAAAQEYEERVESLREITNDCVRILRSHLPGRGTVLDVGCGVGLMVQTLQNAGFQAEGIDLSPRMVTYSRARNPNSPIYEEDFSSFHAPHAYTCVTALAFIHLFPSKQAHEILRKIYELLKPRGVLYIGTTKSERSSEGWEEKRDYQNAIRRFRKHWTEEEFRTALTRANFKILAYHELADPFGKVWMDVVAQKSFHSFL